MDAAAAYDRWHERVHRSEALDDLRLASWHRSALTLAPAVAGRNVLEVGCGAGDFSIYLAETGATVTGIDFSPRAVEIARRKASHRGQRITLDVADAQALPFQREQFDVIFSCECLEHVPSPRRMLSELNRVLKPNGVLVLTTENYSNAMVLSWIHCWLTKQPFDSGAGIQPIEHFLVFWKVRKWMRNAGFRIDRQIGTHHVFLMLPGMHPHTFVKEEFRGRLLPGLLRPLARHVSFRATKRE